MVITTINAVVKMKWLDTKKTYLYAFWISLFVAISLLVTGFFMPPKGKIDGSVLEATGIMFLWPALAFGAKALEEGNTAKIQKGDTTISIGKDE